MNFSFLIFPLHRSEFIWMAFYVLLLAYESLLLCYVLSVEVDSSKEIPLHSFFLLKIIYIPFLCKYINIEKHLLWEKIHKHILWLLNDLLKIKWYARETRLFCVKRASSSASETTYLLCNHSLFSLEPYICYILRKWHRKHQMSWTFTFLVSFDAN